MLGDICVACYPGSAGPPGSSRMQTALVQSGCADSSEASSLHCFQLVPVWGGEQSPVDWKSAGADID